MCAAIAALIVGHYTEQWIGWATFFALCAMSPSTTVKVEK